MLYCCFSISLSHDSFSGEKEDAEVFAEGGMIDIAHIECDLGGHDLVDIGLVGVVGCREQTVLVHILNGQ